MVKPQSRNSSNRKTSHLEMSWFQLSGLHKAMETAFSFQFNKMRLYKLLGVISSSNSFKYREQSLKHYFARKSKGICI